jgi:hypothetical protein
MLDAETSIQLNNSVLDARGKDSDGGGKDGGGELGDRRGVKGRVFCKKGIKKNKIRKRGASWRNLEKWVPPAR